MNYKQQLEVALDAFDALSDLLDEKNDLLDEQKKMTKRVLEYKHVELKDLVKCMTAAAVREAYAQRMVDIYHVVYDKEVEKLMAETYENIRKKCLQE